jgi:hypothetical protein
VDPLTVPCLIYVRCFSLDSQCSELLNELGIKRPQVGETMVDDRCDFAGATQEKGGLVELENEEGGGER